MTADPRPARQLGHERLVPSALLPPEDPSGPRPRTVRDWIVDLSAVVGSAVAGIATLASSPGATVEHLGTTLIVVDVVLGLIACLTLFVRRRFPVGVAIFTGVASAVSLTASLGSSVALFTVAVHRRFVYLFPLGVLHLVAANVSWQINDGDLSLLTTNLVSAAILAIIIGFGMFVRARRQLVWTLQERARRAETEQELLADQARALERARIAREMHDVLGHRISLITLHAGGLELRPDLPADEVAATAALLRSTARQALEELRTVIGVLRDDGTVDAPSEPLPTISDVPRLVSDFRRAGATIGLTVDVEHLDDTPDAVGRVVYRVVQEALTNVAKHAPGAATIVDVLGGPDEGLAVEVRNVTSRVLIGDERPPGSGFGLIGLRERVELADGTLEYGENARGEFVVKARLQWA